ncbi:MAG: class II fructose-1,6-bisphosphate aldolase [Pseudomonadota bacterium]
MFASGREVLAKALAGNYAVGAFNFNNMEALQAIVEAAREARSPVMAQTSEGAIQYAGLEYLACLAATAANRAGVPVVLHLDHGKDLDLIARCLDAGYTSIMIDASDLPLEQNIARTAKVVQLARPYGASVEAELGRLRGVEDLVSVEDKDAVLVDPLEAAAFVKETGIDYLAPAVGTSHGAFKFKGKGELDLPRLSRVREACGLPLVLHGASGVPQGVVEEARHYGARIEGAKGVPDSQILAAIKRGVAKINVDTDLRLASLAALRRTLHEKPSEFDPRRILGPTREAMRRICREKMTLFGSEGRAT